MHGRLSSTVACHGRRSQSQRLSQLAGFNNTRQTEKVVAQFERHTSSKQSINDDAGQSISDVHHVLPADSSGFSTSAEIPPQISDHQFGFSSTGQEKDDVETSTSIHMPIEMSDTSNISASSELDGTKMQCSEEDIVRVQDREASDTEAGEGLTSVEQTSQKVSRIARVAGRLKQRSRRASSHHTFNKVETVLVARRTASKAHEELRAAAETVEATKELKGADSGVAMDNSSWFGLSDIISFNTGPSRAYEELEEEVPPENTWFTNIGRKMSDHVGVEAINAIGLQEEVNWQDERDHMLGLQTREEVRAARKAQQAAAEAQQAAAEALRKLEEDACGQVYEEFKELEQALQQLEEQAAQEGNAHNTQLRCRIKNERAVLEREKKARVLERRLWQLQELATNVGNVGNEELQRHIEQQRVQLEHEQQECQQKDSADNEADVMLMSHSDYELELQMRSCELVMYATAVFDRERLLRENRRVRRHTWNSRWAYMAIQDKAESEFRLHRVQKVMARRHVLQSSDSGLHKARLARNVQAAQAAHDVERWRLREILLRNRQESMISAEAEAAEAAWERALWSLQHEFEAALRSIAECEYVGLGIFSEQSTTNDIPIKKLDHFARSSEITSDLANVQCEDRDLQVEAEVFPNTPSFGSTEQRESWVPFYKRKDILAQVYLRNIETHALSTRSVASALV